MAAKARYNPGLGITLMGYGEIAFTTPSGLRACILMATAAIFVRRLISINQMMADLTAFADIDRQQWKM